jgi:hypothetical protein
MIDPDFAVINEFATRFQQRKTCDVSELRAKLTDWMFEIDDHDYPEESDWSVLRTFCVGDARYLVTFWHDNPKRLHVNISPGLEDRYTYIGKSWSWSIYAEPMECYVSNMVQYDALPDATKQWLDKINTVFHGVA